MKTFGRTVTVLYYSTALVVLIGWGIYSFSQFMIHDINAIRYLITYAIGVLFFSGLFTLVIESDSDEAKS